MTRRRLVAALHRAMESTRIARSICRLFGNKASNQLNEYSEEDGDWRRPRRVAVDDRDPAFPDNREVLKMTEWADTSGLRAPPTTPQTVRREMVSAEKSTQTPPSSVSQPLQSASNLPPRPPLLRRRTHIQLPPKPKLERIDPPEDGSLTPLDLLGDDKPHEK